jgi:hypothetical protein
MARPVRIILGRCSLWFVGAAPVDGRQYPRRVGQWMSAILQLISTRHWQPGDVIDRLVGVIAEIPKGQESSFLVCI